MTGITEAIRKYLKTRADTIDSDIATHDSDIKTLVGTPVTDLSTDIADANAQTVTSEGVITDAITASEVALTAEIDANEAKIDLLQVDTTAIIADLDNATDGLGALKTEIDANETKIDLLQVDTTAIIADLDNATDGLGALKTEIDANETKIDLLQVDTTAILVDTGAIKAVTDLLPDAGALTSLAQDLTVAKEATLGVPVGASLSADIAAIPLVTPDAAGVVPTILGTPLVSDIYTEMAKEGADSDTLETLSDQLDANFLLIDDNSTHIGIIETTLAVPTQDSVSNLTINEVIGNKLDTVLGDSLVAHAKNTLLGVAAVKASTDKLAGATPVVGTATQNWNAAEADIVSIGANDTKNKIHSLFISLHALTATATITIRMYAQVNGTERQFYKQNFVVGTDTAGQLLINGTLGVHEVVRVTAQSNNASDDGLGIAYDALVEVM